MHEQMNERVSSEKKRKKIYYNENNMEFRMHVLVCL